MKEEFLTRDQWLELPEDDFRRSSKYLLREMTEKQFDEIAKDSPRFKGRLQEVRKFLDLTD